MWRITSSITALAEGDGGFDSIGGFGLAQLAAAVEPEARIGYVLAELGAGAGGLDKKRMAQQLSALGGVGEAAFEMREGVFVAAEIERAVVSDQLHVGEFGRSGRGGEGGRAEIGVPIARQRAGGLIGHDHEQRNPRARFGWAAEKQQNACAIGLVGCVGIWPRGSGGEERIHPEECADERGLARVTGPCNARGGEEHVGERAAGDHPREGHNFEVAFRGKRLGEAAGKEAAVIELEDPVAAGLI